MPNMTPVKHPSSTPRPHCYHCQTTCSRRWCTGPDGFRTLCSTCGASYSAQKLLLFQDVTNGRISASPLPNSRLVKVSGFRNRYMRYIQQHLPPTLARRLPRDLSSPIVVPVPEEAVPRILAEQSRVQFLLVGTTTPRETLRPEITPPTETTSPYTIHDFAPPRVSYQSPQQPYQIIGPTTQFVQHPSDPSMTLPTTPFPTLYNLQTPHLSYQATDHALQQSTSQPIVSSENQDIPESASAQTGRARNQTSVSVPNNIPTFSPSARLPLVTSRKRFYKEMISQSRPLPVYPENTQKSPTQPHQLSHTRPLPHLPERSDNPTQTRQPSTQSVRVEVIYDSEAEEAEVGDIDGSEDDHVDKDKDWAPPSPPHQRRTFARFRGRQKGRTQQDGREGRPDVQFINEVERDELSEGSAEPEDPLTPIVSEEELDCIDQSESDEDDGGEDSSVIEIREQRAKKRRLVKFSDMAESAHGDAISPTLKKGGIRDDGCRDAEDDVVVVSVVNGKGNEATCPRRGGADGKRVGGQIAAVDSPPQAELGNAENGTKPPDREPEATPMSDNVLHTGERNSQGEAVDFESGPSKAGHRSADGVPEGNLVMCDISSDERVNADGGVEDEADVQFTFVSDEVIDRLAANSSQHMAFASPNGVPYSSADGDVEKSKCSSDVQGRPSTGEKSTFEGPLLETSVYAGKITGVENSAGRQGVKVQGKDIALGGVGRENSFLTPSNLDHEPHVTPMETERAKFFCDEPVTAPLKVQQNQTSICTGKEVHPLQEEERPWRKEENLPNNDRVIEGRKCEAVLNAKEAHHGTSEVANIKGDNLTAKRTETDKRNAEDELCGKVETAIQDAIHVMTGELEEPIRKDGDVHIGPLVKTEAASVASDDANQRPPGLQVGRESSCTPFARPSRIAIDIPSVIEGKVCKPESQVVNICSADEDCSIFVDASSSRKDAQKEVEPGSLSTDRKPPNRLISANAEKPPTSSATPSESLVQKIKLDIPVFSTKLLGESLNNPKSTIAVATPCGRTQTKNVPMQLHANNTEARLHCKSASRVKGELDSAIEVVVQQHQHSQETETSHTPGKMEPEAGMAGPAKGVPGLIKKDRMEGKEIRGKNEESGEGAMLMKSAADNLEAQGIQGRFEVTRNVMERSLRVVPMSNLCRPKGMHSCVNKNENLYRSSDHADLGGDGNSHALTSDLTKQIPRKRAPSSVPDRSSEVTTEHSMYDVVLKSYVDNGLKQDANKINTLKTHIHGNCGFRHAVATNFNSKSGTLISLHTGQKINQGSTEKVFGATLLEDHTVGRAQHAPTPLPPHAAKQSCNRSSTAASPLCVRMVIEDNAAADKNTATNKSCAAYKTRSTAPITNIVTKLESSKTGHAAKRGLKRALDFVPNPTGSSAKHASAIDSGNSNQGLKGDIGVTGNEDVIVITDITPRRQQALPSSFLHDLSSRTVNGAILHQPNIQSRVTLGSVAKKRKIGSGVSFPVQPTHLFPAHALWNNGRGGTNTEELRSGAGSSQVTQRSSLGAAMDLTVPHPSSSDWSGTVPSNVHLTQMQVLPLLPPGSKDRAVSGERQRFSTRQPQLRALPVPIAPNPRDPSSHCESQDCVDPGLDFRHQRFPSTFGTPPSHAQSPVGRRLCETGSHGKFTNAVETNSTLVARGIGQHATCNLDQGIAAIEVSIANGRIADPSPRHSIAGNTARAAGANHPSQFQPTLGTANGLCPTWSASPVTGLTAYPCLTDATGHSRAFASQPQRARGASPSPAAFQGLSPATRMLKSNQSSGWISRSVLSNNGAVGISTNQGLHGDIENERTRARTTYLPSNAPTLSYLQDNQSRALVFRHSESGHDHSSLAVVTAPQDVLQNHETLSRVTNQSRFQPSPPIMHNTVGSNNVPHGIMAHPLWNGDVIGTRTAGQSVYMGVQSVQTNFTRGYSDTLSVKAEYRQWIRRLSLRKGTTFMNFKANMESVFGLTGNMVLQYLDNEDDFITVSSDTDMRELFVVAQRFQLNPLRVRVYVTA